jgi:hypothetical protein
MEYQWNDKRHRKIEIRREERVPISIFCAINPTGIGLRLSPDLRDERQANNCISQDKVKVHLVTGHEGPEVE